MVYRRRRPTQGERAAGGRCDSGVEHPALWRGEPCGAAASAPSGTRVGRWRDRPPRLGSARCCFVIPHAPRSEVVAICRRWFMPQRRSLQHQVATVCMVRVHPRQSPPPRPYRMHRHGDRQRRSSRQSHDRPPPLQSSGSKPRRRRSERGCRAICKSAAAGNTHPCMRAKPSRCTPPLVAANAAGRCLIALTARVALKTRAGLLQRTDPASVPLSTHTTALVYRTASPATPSSPHLTFSSSASTRST